MSIKKSRQRGEKIAVRSNSKGTGMEGHRRVQSRLGGLGRHGLSWADGVTREVTR